LRVEVGDLLDRPNTRRVVRSTVTLGEDASVAGSHLAGDDDVDVELVIESMPSGVAVDGTVGFAWVGECRRCLGEVRGTARPEVHEIFESDPTPDETFPIEQSQIDLEPVVRESVLLGLPLAPLCGDDCRGPAPESFPARGPDDRATSESPTPGGDPRWSVLDDLEFD
jgi:uncharacterized protein